MGAYHKLAKIIIGTDEAGRGCLAGPVYAASVIFKSKNLVKDIRDSKQLSEVRREELYESLLIEHRVGIGFASVDEITEFNILGAALLAMKRAVENLNLSSEEKKECHVLVDGDQKIRGFDLPQTPVVNGDNLVKEISAASIIAKVARDREIRRLSETYPQYGLAAHKGYATEVHREAIKKFGPSPIHRRTFAGVKEFLTK